MATIKDIAQHTGLSITTVSIVLNGKGDRISKDSIRKIEEAKKLLNYEPNMLASSLRKGTTNIIGIVVSDLHPYFIRLAQLIERDMTQQGYQVLIVGTDETDEKCEAAIDNFLNFKVAGMILAVTEGVKERITRLAKQNIPFVMIDRYFKGVTSNMVLLDNYRSSYNAVDYLIKRGRTKIATFHYDTKMHHMLDRFDGYRAALNDNGIRYNKRFTPTVSFDAIDKVEIEAKIRELVEVHKVDALYFQTNRVAIPGIEALFKMGYKVPDDVAIMCFHDTDFFGLLKPSISAMVQPLEDMAKECVAILLADIRGELNTKIRRVFLSNSVVERASV